MTPKYACNVVVEAARVSLLASGQPAPVADTASKLHLRHCSLAHASPLCQLDTQGLRCSNIIFFVAPGSKPSYEDPILSGFDYARPDLVGEVTEVIQEHSQHDIYRHPSKLQYAHSRSKKSHDIYSLGIVLIEIAHWKRIDDVVHLPEDEKQARKMVRVLQQILLDYESMEDVQGHAGDLYAHAVRKCLEGVVSSTIDETDPVIGAEMQKAFSEEVVDRLRDMKL